jgi:hypothetical protein
MGYSFFHRLGTLGRHLVTEEGDLGCLEDALCRVNEDPIPLKSVEESLQMLLVLLERPGENRGVLQVGGCICKPAGGRNGRGNRCQ